MDQLAIKINTEIKNWFSKSILDWEFDIDYEILYEALSKFKTDYQRYYPNCDYIQIEKIRIRVELQSILLYRLSRLYHLEKKNIIAEKLSALGRFLTGIEIYYSSDIGNGLKINHGVGTVIGARTVIGDNALIHQGVTFGDKNGARPVIGKNVTIYAGAIILGGIYIVDNSLIGANSVVMIDVPDNSVVAGTPGKIIKIENK